MSSLAVLEFLLIDLHTIFESPKAELYAPTIGNNVHIKLLNQRESEPGNISTDGSQDFV